VELQFYCSTRSKKTRNKGRQFYFFSNQNGKCFIEMSIVFVMYQGNFRSYGPKWIVVKRGYFCQL